jgi:hypothetical protein
MNRFKGMVLVLAAMAIPAAAQAQVIGFDDLGNTCGTQLTNGYQGFNWNNFYVLNPAFCGGSLAVSGYAHGTVSQGNVAYNAFAQPAQVSSPNPFTFNSVYMTGAWNDGVSVVVTGWLGSTQLYQQTVTVNSHSPTNFVFNWSGVDMVDFNSFGGVDQGYGGGGSHVAFDDMDLGAANAAPEPVTLLLLGSGLTGVGAWRRRRRTNVQD